MYFFSICLITLTFTPESVELANDHTSERAESWSALETGLPFAPPPTRGRVWRSAHPHVSPEEHGGPIHAHTEHVQPTHATHACAHTHTHAHAQATHTGTCMHTYTHPSTYILHTGTGTHTPTHPLGVNRFGVLKYRDH